MADMWLEASKLVDPDEAKDLIAQGVRSIPNSVNLWLEALKLKNNDSYRIRVLKDGIDQIPGSVRLRKALVELLNETATTDLLKDAADLRLSAIPKKLQICRDFVPLWLSLAKIEEERNIDFSTTLESNMTLGVRSIPNSVNLWLEALKLKNNDSYRIKVLKDRIDQIPGSVRLRKALVELLNETATTDLLKDVVEVCA
ncbi:hypothetical protein TSUD_153970 [Trifolium subterraneum]|uniref:Uncharacterized protein n=1 Tax=Trifolium subterraneum TaxID=3900 RepID=A0A2Z6MYK8_TRISU|nr:hypothetical protein TSUD_153970 [Trifolium subterraneum]